MAQFSFEDVMAEARKPKYDRIVSCRNCHEQGLIFDTSKNGNPWLYSASELLTEEQVTQVRDEGRFVNQLREIALGRDPEQDGKLVTGFVLVLKNKPHPACKLENQLADEPTDVGQTGTIDVSVKADGTTPVNPADQRVDESIDTPYDGTQEQDSVEEQYGLVEYTMLDE